MADKDERYEEFMEALRTVLYRYNAEIRMKHNGYGNPRGYGIYSPDVIEVTLDGHETYELGSRIDSETM